MNGQRPPATDRNCQSRSANSISPSSTSIPGLIEATRKVWPGAVVRLRRSVKRIVPLAPRTGPKAAAKSRSSVVNWPELATPFAPQSSRPVPLTCPLIFATTPRARRDRSSGWSRGSNCRCAITRSAWPRPLDRSWRMSAAVTIRSLAGLRRSAKAVIRLFSSASVASRATSGSNRSGSARSVRVKLPSDRSSRPPA